MSNNTSMGTLVIRLPPNFPEIYKFDVEISLGKNENVDDQPIVFVPAAGNNVNNGESSKPPQIPLRKPKNAGASKESALGNGQNNNTEDRERPEKIDMEPDNVATFERPEDNDDDAENPDRIEQGSDVASCSVEREPAEEPEHSDEEHNIFKSPEVSNNSKRKNGNVNGKPKIDFVPPVVNNVNNGESSEDRRISLRPRKTPESSKEKRKPAKEPEHSDEECSISKSPEVLDNSEDEFDGDQEESEDDDGEREDSQSPKKPERILKNSGVPRGKPVMKSKFKKLFPEAWKGHDDGSHKLMEHGVGFPQKKFSEEDLKTFGRVNKSWTVQAIYPTSNSDEKLVVYEGWSCSYIQHRNSLTCSEDLISECDAREKIINAIEKKMKVNKRTESFYRGMDKMLECDSVFWCYEDLTYFINGIAGRFGHDKTYFFLSRVGGDEEKQIEVWKDKFPKIEFIFKNLVSNTALMEFNRNYEKEKKNRKAIMERDKKQQSSNPKRKSPCSSPRCKCSSIFWESYNDFSKRMPFYTRKGYLDLAALKKEELEIIMECSDECGCDRECITRNLQRGPQIPLAVVLNLDETGFEVRAGGNIKPGQFIIEYIGAVKPLNKKKADCTYEISTYDEDFVIDSSKKGNISRYINHCCAPNAAFIAVHSRDNLNTPLVPRVGVFATKEIKRGEQVTIFYWTEEELATHQKKQECKCGATNCVKLIPLMNRRRLRRRRK